MDTAINKQEEQQYISTIKVEGLFGKFDHTIKLKEGGLTILYGENGVGKTTLFKLIYHGLKYCNSRTKSMNNSQIRSLRFINFNKILLIDQYDKEMYFIRKEQSLEQKDLENEIKSISNITSAEETRKITPHVYRKYYHTIVRTLPFRLRKQYEILPKENKILNKNTKGKFSEKDFIKKYSHVANEISLYKSYNNGDYYANPYIITSNRIQEKEEIKVNKIARDFFELINEYENEFEDRILTLTSSLNSRITNGEVSTDFEEKELKEKLKKLKKRVQELKKVGLLYQQETPITTLSDKLTEVAKTMVAINTNEYLNALYIFNELYPKLYLFLDIINNRRFNYKTIAINKVEGLTVRDNEGNLFPLSNLSSGEQHELILIYELLFGHQGEQKKIFLIDEPEISLHVLWQMDFIKDMQEIIKLTGVQIIAATHSPAIINGNWDLTVQLKHPEQKSDTEGAEKEGGNE